MINAIELVGYGHPDRFADYISEKILDTHLKGDKYAKVAAEVMVTRDKIFLGGEITSQTKVNYKKLVYQAIEEIYGTKWWKNYKKVKIINNIKKQSNELNKLQSEQEIIAGDQGIIYGYYNHKRFEMIKSFYQMMKDIKNKFDIAPDWKLLYIFDQELSMSLCGIKKELYNEIKKFILNYDLKAKFDNLIINPAGEWMICGPQADTGLTGRKLMMESFNAGLPHGGGAFCGKDISKVDKSAVIWATYLTFLQYKFEKNDNKDYIVRLIFKISDHKPIIESNFTFSKAVQKESKLNLNEFIHQQRLLEKNDWSTNALNGGMIDLIKEFNS